MDECVVITQMFAIFFVQSNQVGGTNMNVPHLTKNLIKKILTRCIFRSLLFLSQSALLFRLNKEAVGDESLTKTSIFANLVLN